MAGGGKGGGGAAQQQGAATTATPGSNYAATPGAAPTPPAGTPPPTNAKTGAGTPQAQGAPPPGMQDRWNQMQASTGFKQWAQANRPDLLGPPPGQMPNASLYTDAAGNAAGPIMPTTAAGESTAAAAGTPAEAGMARPTQPAYNPAMW